MESRLKQNVDSARAARGLSERELCERLQISPPALADALNQTAKKNIGLIKKIATELVVPEIALSLSKPPELEEQLVSFRFRNPKVGAYSRKTIKAISLAQSIQNSANNLDVFDASKSLSSRLPIKLPPMESALALRKMLNITDQEQIDFVSHDSFYKHIRKFVESFEIIVLQLQFSREDGSGICLASSSGYDLIAVNTNKQNRARRLFTLMHEVYHCILGLNGISSTEAPDNRIEKNCNKFSINFIAPESLVRSVATRVIKTSRFDNEQLARFSKLSKLSLQASLYRLIEFGIYDPTARQQWDDYVAQIGDPDEPSSSGGINVDQWRVKLAQFGFTFAKIFGSSQAKDSYDAFDIYNITGLKPKYHKEFFQNAIVANAQDIGDE